MVYILLFFKKHIVPVCKFAERDTEMKRIIPGVLVLFLFIAGPTQSAALKNGDLVISEVVTNEGTIYSLDQYTGSLDIIATGGPVNHPEGMAITQDGQIIVTDWWAWTNPAEATSGQRSI